MDGIEVHELMDMLYAYGDGDAGDYGSWDDELVDEEFYNRYDFERRNKIVELADTGCDARSPGRCTENNLASNPVKITKLDHLNGSEKVPKGKPKDRILKKTFKPSANDSLLNLAVSNSTNVVSDRDTRKRPTTKFEDFFDDFGDINERATEGNYKTFRDEHSYDYQRDEIQNRRKFVDRAVDSDDLSNSSKCALQKETSGPDTRTELKGRQKKVSCDSNFLKNKTKPKRIARTKVLTKSSDSANEDVSSANKSRLKSSHYTPKKISSPAKNLKNRQGSESRSDSLHGRQKLVAASRMTVKKKNPKVTKEALLKPSKSSLQDDEKGGRIVKKLSFQGSKLPVWQGWHKKSKVPLNVNRAKKQEEINIKEFEDEIYVTSNATENTEASQSGDANVKSTIKAEESIEENPEVFTFGKIKDCLRRSKLEGEDDVVTLKSETFLETINRTDSIIIEHKLKSETFLETINRTESIIIEHSHDDKEIMKHEEDKDVKDVEKQETSAGNKRSREIKSKDESSSELWTENCEKAFARGTAIGLKLHRMAKALREKGRKEFAKYGFENNYYKENYSKMIEIPLTIPEDYLSSKLQYQ